MGEMMETLDIDRLKKAEEKYNNDLKDLKDNLYQKLKNFTERKLKDGRYTLKDFESLPDNLELWIEINEQFLGYPPLKSFIHKYNKEVDFAPALFLKIIKKCVKESLERNLEKNEDYLKLKGQAEELKELLAIMIDNQAEEEKWLEFFRTSEQNIQEQDKLKKLYLKLYFQINLLQTHRRILDIKKMGTNWEFELEKIEQELRRMEGKTGLEDTILQEENLSKQKEAIDANYDLEECRIKIKIYQLCISYFKVQNKLGEITKEEKESKIQDYKQALEEECEKLESLKVIEQVVKR